jgi:RNA polymerase sigma-70 factor (ECF subfamily)
MTVNTDMDEIFRTSHGRLVSSMYALTGDLAEAQDAVSEAFVRAMSYRQQVGCAEAWLFAVARNVAWSRRRRDVRLPVLLRKAAGTESGGELSPDRVMLVAAIRRLPARQRDALALHHLVDLPVAEVASILGISENTVKSWLRRGRAALATQLRDGSGGGDQAGRSRRSRPACLLTTT